MSSCFSKRVAPQGGVATTLPSIALDCATVDPHPPILSPLMCSVCAHDVPGPGSLSHCLHHSLGPVDQSQQHGEHNNFRKNALSEKVILGALTEFWGITGATFGIQKVIPRKRAPFSE